MFDGSMRPSVEPAETHHDGNILQSRGYRGWKLERWTAMARKWIRLGLELSLSSRVSNRVKRSASNMYQFYMQLLTSKVSYGQQGLAFSWLPQAPPTHQFQLTSPGQAIKPCSLL
ncbi:hypothetical protein A9K55_003595 [Cordyceps militaris]|uniref:Uncharacterized protein n=1 Tax=Cordyceps militaris TaxID=73501 RepID=A0A2H4S5X1_CORMI|nr:hypothetical protein A9K55_003595 [Cordyceps militaris]